MKNKSGIAVHLNEQNNLVGPASADSTVSKFRPMAGACGDTRRHTSSKWQRERSRRVHQMCLGIERQIAAGRKLKTIIRRYARQFRNRYYVSERSRLIRLGAGTILRLLYAWREGGRTPEAVRLHYRPSRQKIPGSQVADFALAALAPDVTSMKKAHAHMPQPCGTWDAYRHNVKGKLLAALTRLFAMRRALKFQESRTQRIVEDFAVEDFATERRRLDLQNANGLEEEDRIRRGGQLR